MKTNLNIEISDEMAKFIKHFAETTKQDPKIVLEKFLTLGLNSGAKSIKEAVELGKANYLEALRIFKETEKYKIEKIPTYQEVERAMHEYTKNDPDIEWMKKEAERINQEHENNK